MDRYDLLGSFLSSHAQVKKKSMLILHFVDSSRASKDCFLDLTEEEVIVSGALLAMDAFRDAVGNKVDVCGLSTACSSGGWDVNPQLNTIAMAVAAPGVQCQKC